MANKKSTPEKTYKIIYYRDQYKTFLGGDRLRTTKAKAEKHAKEHLKNSSFANSYHIIEEKDEKVRKKVSPKVSEDDQIGKNEKLQ